MTDIWLAWYMWEQHGGRLAPVCRRDLRDRVLAFERGADKREKAAMFQAHPLYVRAACIPFWASGAGGVEDSRVVGFFDALEPDERTALLRLRVALELWQAARLCSE